MGSLHRLHLGKSDRCTIGAKACRFIKFEATTGDYYFMVEGADDYAEIIHHDRLSNLMASPDWRHEPGYYDPDHKRGGRKAEGRLALARPRQRYKSVFNHYVSGCLHIEIQRRTTTLSDASLKEFRKRLEERFREAPTDLRRKLGHLRPDEETLGVPGVSALRRHYRIYRASCGDILAHKDKKPRVLKRYSAACAEALAATYDQIRKALTRETRGKSAPARAVIEGMCELNEQRRTDGLQGLYIYSERQIQRMIANLSPFEVCCAQEGIDKARHKFSSYLSGVSPICPLERVEIDDWEADVMTWFRYLGLTELLPNEILEKLPIGRRWICVAIDVASRNILGLRIAEAPSAEEFRKLLEMVVSDKTDLARACGASGSWHQCGRPMTVATDTGSAFVATASSERANDLGSGMEHAPVRCAELRGTDERFFGTMHRTLTPRLPGHTHSNPDQCGDYDPRANACLDDDDLIRILVCYIVDEYHRNPHGGLGGQMPISKWHDLEKEAKSLQPPVDRLDRCAALGVDITAKLGKQGVVVFGNHYSCEELRALYADGKTPEIPIRVDISNLGMVAVGVGEKWVKALPHTRDMEGISLPEWEEQWRALRTRFKYEAELSAEYRGHAAKTIRDVATNARARLRRQQATPFGHSAAYVQHLHSTLFVGFRFREEAELSFEESPDGIGREILPAPDPEPRAIENTAGVDSNSGEDDDSWKDWPDQPGEDWRLEDEQ